MTYSLPRNLRYLAMAYYRPGALVEEFARETSLLYGLVPFGLKFFIVDELLYFQAYLANARTVSPLPKVLPIPDEGYYLWVMILGPFMNALGAALFAGVIAAAARLTGWNRIMPLKATAFFLCVGASFGLAAVVVDQVYHRWPLPVLTWIHPLAGLVSIGYLAAFLRCQAGLLRWQALALAVLASLIFLGFRIVLFR